MGLNVQVICAPEVEMWVVQGKEGEEQFSFKIILGFNDSLFPSMTTSV